MSRPRKVARATYLIADQVDTRRVLRLRHDLGNLMRAKQPLFTSCGGSRYESVTKRLAYHQWLVRRMSSLSTRADAES